MIQIFSAYDSTNHDIYVANQFSNNVYVIDDVTNPVYIRMDEATNRR